MSPRNSLEYETRCCPIPLNPRLFLKSLMYSERSCSQGMRSAKLLCTWGCAPSASKYSIHHSLVMLVSGVHLGVHQGSARELSRLKLDFVIGLSTSLSHTSIASVSSVVPRRLALLISPPVSGGSLKRATMSSGERFTFWPDARAGTRVCKECSVSTQFTAFGIRGAVKGGLHLLRYRTPFQWRRFA
jgi:hypothetical protein